MKRLIGFVLTLCLIITLVPSAVFAEDTEVAEAVDNSHLITYQKPGIYDYEIATDPMQIADDEFFGVWDEEAQDWAKQPYFRYDEFPDMIKVKEAAMSADYDLAKEELLNYYRSVSDTRFSRVTSNPGSHAKMRAVALEKNVYTVDTLGGVQGFVNFDNEWSQQSIDVGNAVISSKVIGSVADVGFILMSVDKHLTQAEVKSRESDTPPVLELVVNGLPVRIEATKDAMVRAGAYSKVNYGFEPIMTVQESGTYKNFNEKTMRAFISFDISRLKTTDTVTSAKLVLNGRNASGTGEKEICVYKLSDMIFEESDIVFDDYATECALWSCNDQNTWDFVASNNTSVKGKACNYHRGGELSVLADMYDYTKDERYAYTFIRQHMGLVHNVGFNTDMFNALDISNHLSAATKNVFQVMDSKYMTGETLTAMIKTFWLQAHENLTNFYGTKDNNWASFATCGVYSFIARFREVAVYDEWYKITQDENYRITKGFVLEDGMCYELPLTYTSTILGTLYDPYIVQDETGISVPFDEEVLNIAYNIVKSLVYCSSPGFRGYNIADGCDFQFNYGKNTVKSWYAMAFSDDEMFEYVATNGTSGAMPENPTTRYPTSLRTYMRSSWADNALAMSFINTDHNTASHGQYDHLSITMFAYGKYLLADPGLGTSLLDGAKEYISSAPLHNLVTVNNSDHNRISKTRELAFESNKIYDFVDYAGSYTQDVNQSRNVLFLKEQKFWIVGDYANPENQTKENSFEQNWQMLPASKISVDEQTLEIRSNNDDINVNLIPVGTDGLNSYFEETVFAHRGGAMEVNKKAVLQKSAVGDAVFNTIILPRNLKEDFEVTADIVDTGIDPAVVNAFSARIKNTLTGKENYYYYYHLNDLSKKQEANVGQFTTDATTMLVETDLDGNITSTFLMDATFLKDNTIDEEGQYLFKLKEGSEPVSAIAYEKNGQIFNVYSSTLNEEVLENVTMYAPGQYNVRFEGSFMDGKKSGNYLYFGDEPIIVGKDTDDSEDSEDDVQTPEKPSGGVHGSGGSGGGGGGGYAPTVKPTPDDGKENEDNKNDEGQIIVPPVSTDTVPSNITKELEGHWGEEEITSLYKAGIVTGDTTGLRLKDGISRAEFVTLMVRALNMDLKVYDNNFTDVDENNWYTPYVATAYDAGFVVGSDGKFRPDDMITREEMCKIIAQVTDLDYELKENNFTDRHLISDWALEYVNKAHSLGIINGMDDGSFEPKSNLLREQAFVILTRVIDIIK